MSIWRWRCREQHITAGVQAWGICEHVVCRGRVASCAQACVSELHPTGMRGVCHRIAGNVLGHCAAVVLVPRRGLPNVDLALALQGATHHITCRRNTGVSKARAVGEQRGVWRKCTQGIVSYRTFSRRDEVSASHALVDRCRVGAPVGDGPVALVAVAVAGAHCCNVDTGW